MQLEHRLSALFQLHLHSRFNDWFSGLSKDNCKTRRETLKIFGFGAPYTEGLTVIASCTSLQQDPKELNHWLSQVEVVHAYSMFPLVPHQHTGVWEMAVILHRTFSNAFSCMVIIVFGLIFVSNAFRCMNNIVFGFNFHWRLFLVIQLTIRQHWFR